MVNYFTDVDGRVDWTSDQTTENNLLAELETKTQAAVTAMGSTMTVALESTETKQIAEITPYLGIVG